MLQSYFPAAQKGNIIPAWIIFSLLFEWMKHYIRGSWGGVLGEWRMSDTQVWVQLLICDQFEAAKAFNINLFVFCLNVSGK